MSDTHKQLIEKVNASFEQNQPERFLDMCAENVTWRMAGHAVQEGKAAVRMASMGDMEPPKININSIISDGDRAACYGDMTMKDKDGSEAEFDYCDIYKFEGEKIVDLTSFMSKRGAESCEAESSE
ncbi:MAG: nuclear transport factor 2 family protein [Blastocatellia bacterium]|nr:nuclear transport factor 2 family protein [Blastocatellia bacterium]